MIKHLLKCLLVMSLINSGCSAQKNLVEQNINETGDKQPVEDAELKKLQADNDLVIAFAIENYAWVKSMDYTIIAKKDNEWKGYKYHLNLMPNKAGSPTAISPVQVDAAACESILKYINDNKSWTIKGDNGENFCTDGNKNCNINDVASERLWLITKTSYINPSYYAPEFYEKCCPEKQRGIFLSITQKIAALVPSANE